MVSAVFLLFDPPEVRRAAILPISVASPTNTAIPIHKAKHTNEGKLQLEKNDFL
jgi:hypothetical protein